MGARIDIDTTQFSRGMLRYAEALHLNKPKVLREQMRLLLKRILDFLPPGKRAVGVKAIDKDVSQQFVDPNLILNSFTGRTKSVDEAFNKYMRNKDYDKLQTLCNRTGLLNGLEIKEFGKEEIKRSDHGRIIQNGKKILPLNRKPLTAYADSLKKNVGKLKGSLKNAYERLGGKLPAWIKAGNEYQFTDKSEDKDHPFIEVASLVEYGGDVNQRYNVLQKALDTRVRDIDAAIVKGVLNKAQQAFYGKS